MARRIADDEWVKEVTPAYQQAKALCDNFKAAMAGDDSMKKINASEVAFTELPRLRNLIKSNSEPSSSEARQAHKNLEKGIGEYLTAVELFAGLVRAIGKGLGERAQYSKGARLRITTQEARIAGKVLSAGEKMIMAEGFLSSMAGR